MKVGTIERWRARLDRALALLTEEIDGPPSLERLAGAAAVSPYHFHRIWRSLTGEPLGATIRRLRAERAGQALKGSDASVTEIALEAGYATPQSFAKSFRAATGVSPSAFRSGAGAATSPSGAYFRVEIATLEPFVIIAKRRDGGPYSNLNGEFGLVFEWAAQADLLGSLRGIWGIPHDDPASVLESRLRYDAGIDLGADVAPPPHLRRVNLGGGRYARLRVAGSYDGLEAADQYLVGVWLLESGEEPADEPLLHHFLNDPEETPEPELITDIYLRLKNEEDEPCG